MHNKIGLWLIGAKGSVATTVSLGLCGLVQGKIDNCGLVSTLPQFDQLGLIDWNQIVVGGHEIRNTSLIEEARKLSSSTRAFDPQLVNDVADRIAEIDNNIRPGILANQGSAIDAIADKECSINRNDHTYRELISAVQNDLRQFVEQHQLAGLVVVNIASTEPPCDTNEIPDSWVEFSKLLESGDLKIASSSLYAIAAFELGYSFVNFTPSLGSNFAALKDLALQRKVCHTGQDGKTGETLVKSALAPMFAHRNLQVMSWVGQNIFGNLDAKILDEPENKLTKVKSKDGLLSQILGYHPQSHISIENISSLGDWKTAWDHIHFKGFLGTPMVMQFIWQGCDSILAAPLVLDLFRFTEKAVREKQSGVLDFLSSFFKSPMWTDKDQPHDQALTSQFAELISWSQKFTGA